MARDRIHDPIEPAVIEWRDGAPYAPRFGDIYFSKDGPAETAYVFLEQNRLAERFREGRPSFVIGETGFGTGLNFLSTYRLWRREAPVGARLMYVTTELHPLVSDDLARVHAAWPELVEEAAWLREAYPPSIPGFHLRRLPHGVDLLIGWGDALTLLEEQPRLRCDAWFLDGFAPARNAEMWQPELLKMIARRTAAGGTLASFTAAGEVRQGLAEAGFTVTRVPGFGRKRHMTTATLGEPQKTASPPRDAAVIGGGIAGAGAARALAERGWGVTLFERQAKVAAEASGNPAAILFPRIHRQWDAATRFYLGGYAHLLSRLAGLGMAALPGMVQLPKSQRGVRTERGFADLPERLGLPADIIRRVEQEEASRLTGHALALGGLHFVRGGSLSLGKLVEALLDHPAITLRTGESVDALHLLEGTWEVASSSYRARVAAVVLANAGAAENLLGKALSLAPVAGQLSLLDNECSFSQRMTLGYGGSLSPYGQKGYALGSSFHSGNTEVTNGEGDHRRQLEKLAEIAPSAAKSLAELPLSAWRRWSGVRWVSRDRMPLVGLWQEGLAVSIAHGSRGAVSALLAGEMVAARLTGEPSPVDACIEASLDPWRFS